MANEAKTLTAAKQKIADQVCSGIAAGGSLRSVCKPKGMPNKSTIAGWVRAYPKFAAQYARAREEQAEAFFEEIIEISDDAGFDYKVVDGDVIVDGDAIQRARLRTDSRKWVASKMLPKKYGDKVDLTIHTEAPPLTINFNVSEPKGDVRVTKT